MIEDTLFELNMILYVVNNAKMPEVYNIGQYVEDRIKAIEENRKNELVNEGA